MADCEVHCQLMSVALHRYFADVGIAGTTLPPESGNAAAQFNVTVGLRLVRHPKPLADL